MRREELWKAWTIGGVQIAQVLTLIIAAVGMPLPPGPLLCTLTVVSVVQNTLSYRYHWTCAFTSRGECPSELCAQFAMDTWGIAIHAGVYVCLLFLALAPMHPPGGFGVACGALVFWVLFATIHWHRIGDPVSMVSSDWPDTPVAYRALAMPSGCVLLMMSCAAYATTVCPILAPLWVFATLSYATASAAQVYAPNGGVWCHLLLMGANCACMWMLYLLECGVCDRR